MHDNSVVVGVPGQVIARTKPHTSLDRPDLAHADQPDLIGAAVREAAAGPRRQVGATVSWAVVQEFLMHSTSPGVWQEIEDYSI